MELLTSLFDRRRTKTSCILLTCTLWLRGRWMQCLGTRGTTLQRVSSRAALHKQIVSLILPSTASCPGRAQQGCEWDTQVTKFCQNHRACCCQRYLLPLLNYQGFRRSRKMWRKQESQQWQKICWFIMGLLTENVIFFSKNFLVGSQNASAASTTRTSR